MASSASKNTVKRMMANQQDLGKPNVSGKTGFATVAAKGAEEYNSKEVGQKVAGSIFQKMRKAKKL